jgi:hypothetical protein
MLSYKRGKRDIIAENKIADIYKFYKSSINNPVSQSVVKAVYKDVFPELIKLIVLENFEFRMPGKLGHLRVRKKRIEAKIDNNGDLDTRALSINWKKTKQLWEKKYEGLKEEELLAIPDKPVIRELNEHTDGYRFMWHWDKRATSIPSQNAYYIQLTRANKKILSQASKTNELNFFE